MLFGKEFTNYRAIYDTAANATLTVGNATDPTNYYDNTTHKFNSRGGFSTFATLSASALTLSVPLNYGGVTLSNSVTGTGSMALSASPTVSGTLSGAAASFTGDLTVNTGATTNISTVALTNTGSAGINIKLAGDGATTPNKFIRVNAGLFQLVNSTYSAVILSLTDAGALNVGTSLSAATGVYANSTDGFYLGGTSARLFVSGNYLLLTDTAGLGYALQVGNAADPNTYYNNGSHFFRSRNGTTSYGNFSTSGLTLYGATSGTIKFTPTAVAGSNTLTMPAETGTLRTTVSSGTVLQVVNYQTGAVATGTTAIPFDDTIPQNTEGDEYMSLAITPKSATSKLLIQVTVQATCSVLSWVNAALFQDSTANALAAAFGFTDAAASGHAVEFTHYMTSGTTSSTTFKVRAGVNVAGTITFNGQYAVRKFGGVLASSITITEVVP